jgi:hypothetical protein
VKFDLKKPCHNCPFLKKGGIRLYRSRVEEIAGAMLESQGATFACHKTTIPGTDDEGGEGMVMDADSRHCAGALIFAEKHRNATQMMRIAERLGWYDAKALMADKEAVGSVFDSLREMLRVNERDQSAPRKRARR